MTIKPNVRFQNRLPALDIDAGIGEFNFRKAFQLLPPKTQSTVAKMMVASLPAEVRDKLPQKFQALQFVQQAMEAGLFDHWTATAHIHLKRESTL